MKNSILLIDANSIINRAYFGLAGRSKMTAYDGTPTGALFAFINIYLKYIQDLKPTHVCACFDLKAPTFRHLKYDQYKATRKSMPEDLAQQMPILKEILDVMGVPRLEMEGFEADDLIGSLSFYSKELEWDTFILSGDKDDLQLVDDKTIVLMPTTRSGVTTTDRYDVDAVIEKYQITPKQFIDFKAIMGDPSDNIPGVKGIGEKGAIELLIEFGTLENIYESLDEIKPTLSKKLSESKEIAFTSKWLATIKRDIPIKEFLYEINNYTIDKDKAYSLFNKLGFKSIINKMSLTPSINASSNISDNQIGFESDNKKEIIFSAEQTKSISIKDVSIDELRVIFKSSNVHKFDDLEIKRPIKDIISHEIINQNIKEESGFVTCMILKDNSILIDCNTKELYKLNHLMAGEFLKLLSSEKIRLVGVDIKAFLRNHEIDTNDILIFDIFVAAYLLSQIEGKATIERVSQVCLGSYDNTLDEDSNDNKPKQQTLFDDNIELLEQQDEKVLEKAVYDLYILAKIANFQYNELKKQNMEFLSIYVEMPLVAILSQMERIGFAIDNDVLIQLSNEFIDKIKEYEKNIYEYANCEFNINSPKQLGEVLFKKLLLPTGRKTQSGYSTDADVLEKLYDKHPIIKEIISYRQLSKLKSTFVDGLSKSISASDGRVHTTFNQTLTTTGRLSSSDPNLQNIPVKLDAGREIRKAFIAKDGCVLVDADYSQIELRLLAQFSNDDEMMTAFINNDDIHMNTAQEIFDMPRDLITSSMRSAAKTINFSIVYGIGDFSLAQDLGITLKEAHTYILEYYKKYPSVKPYLESLIKNAYENGYVETLFFRRRYIEELKSTNKNVKMFGERVAMNTPVQGTAADIIKIAMVLVNRKLKENNCSAKLILQVHDELILEVPIEESEIASRILKQSMEDAVKLSIPLIAEVKTGRSWYDTK